MKKLITLIKTEGKSKEEIAEEMIAILKQKGFLDKDGKLQLSDQKQNLEVALPNPTHESKKQNLT